MATQCNGILFSGKIDLNGLFNLSYNFDLLKGIIEGLINNQQETNQRLTEIEERFKTTVRIEKEKTDKSINMKCELNSFEYLEGKEEEIIKKNNDNNDQIEGDNTILNINMSNDEISQKIIKKLNYLDQQVTKCLNQSYQSGDVKTTLNDHDRELGEVKILMQKLFDKTDEHDKQLQELSSKLADFNIIDILNSKAGSAFAEDDNTSTGVSMSILANLEKRYNQKFKYVDERLGKVEEEMHKIKNENLNSKNFTEQMNKNVNTLKEQIVNIFAKMEDLKNSITSTIDLNVNDFNEKIDKLKDYIDEKNLE